MQNKWFAILLSVALVVAIGCGIAMGINGRALFSQPEPVATPAPTEISVNEIVLENPFTLAQIEKAMQDIRNVGEDQGYIKVISYERIEREKDEFWVDANYYDLSKTIAYRIKYTQGDEEFTQVRYFHNNDGTPALADIVC